MNETLQNAKKKLRRQILQNRASLTGAERTRASLLMKERMLSHPWYEEADILLGFVSYGSEIDTKGILAEALRAGKAVYVPKIEHNENTGEREMQFYRINTLEELCVGYKGIPEPTGASERFIYRETADRTLMLMPGVAFDQECNRMGYGGGYYDRFLADKQTLALRTIAVGFACQMVEQVPAGARDVKPCQVLCM